MSGHRPARVVRGRLDTLEGLPGGCGGVVTAYAPDPLAHQDDEPPLPVPDPGSAGRPVVGVQHDVAGEELAVDREPFLGDRRQGHSVALDGPLPGDVRKSPFRIVLDPVGSGERERAVRRGHRRDTVLLPVLPVLGCVRRHVINPSIRARPGRGTSATWCPCIGSGTRRAPGAAAPPGPRTRRVRRVSQGCEDEAVGGTGSHALVELGGDRLRCADDRPASGHLDDGPPNGLVLESRARGPTAASGQPPRRGSPRRRHPRRSPRSRPPDPAETVRRGEPAGEFVRLVEDRADRGGEPEPFELRSNPK